MRKITLTTFILANLSFSATACEFHGGGYFSPYDWNAGDFFNHIPIEETTSASSENERAQPDFRYNRAQRPVNDEEKSNEEQDETEG